MLSFCKEYLKIEVYSKTKQRGKAKGNIEELNNEVDKKINSISSFKSIIEDARIKYSYIFDISEEMLSE